MNKTIKALLICLSVVAIAAGSVLGTMAWLTDRDEVVNTFTVGQVDITVNEADVTPDGTPIDGADRVQGNEYHLIPGQSYTKDPTMTVNGKSEESYVRMMLTLNCKAELDTIFAPGVELTSIFQGYDPEAWSFVTETADTEKNTVTYEFRYKATVNPEGNDVKLEPLFTSFEIPGTLDGADLESIAALNITVEGHAIQALGFENADEAWAAFELQMEDNT